MKQQTLDEQTLQYLPAPPHAQSDEPVYEYHVVFTAVETEDDDFVTETVYIQDGERDGQSSEERASIAAKHKISYDVSLNSKYIQAMETEYPGHRSDEWRVDDCS